MFYIVEQMCKGKVTTKKLTDYSDAIVATEIYVSWKEMFRIHTKYTWKSHDRQWKKEQYSDFLTNFTHT